MSRCKHPPQSSIFSQFLCSLRSVFMLRHWVEYLPISTPAPRIPISGRNLERNAQLYADEYQSESELIDSTLSSSLKFDSSQLSIVPQDGLVSSSCKNSPPSYRTSPTGSKLSVKYIGTLPPRLPFKQGPTIFAFNVDHGRFEKCQEDDECPEPFFLPDITFPNRRLQRIRDRCDEWLCSSSQYYGQPPDSSSQSDIELELGTQLSSAINPDDSVSQVAARQMVHETSVKAISAAQSADRVAQLENQLAFLRAQLAEVIYKQTVMQTEIEAKKVTSSIAVDIPPSVTTPNIYREISVIPTASVLAGRVIDDIKNIPPYSPKSEIGSDSGVMTGTCSGVVSVPLPPSPQSLIPLGGIPPPPPPPPPPNRNSDWRRKLLEKRGVHPSKIPTTQTSGDMSQVLKELTSGTIKLRAVRRSAGGTPIRDTEDTKRLDPAEFIGRALKAKFANIRYELESPDKSIEAENHDFSPPPVPVLKTPVLRNTYNQRPEVHSTMHFDNTLPNRNVYSKGFDDSELATAPVFGRHLLRPVDKENLPPSMVTELNFNDPEALASTPERR